MPILICGTTRVCDTPSHEWVQGVLGNFQPYVSKVKLNDSVLLLWPSDNTFSMTELFKMLHVSVEHIENIFYPTRLLNQRCLLCTEALWYLNLQSSEISRVFFNVAKWIQWEHKIRSSDWQKAQINPLMTRSNCNIQYGIRISHWETTPCPFPPQVHFIFSETESGASYRWRRGLFLTWKYFHSPGSYWCKL